MIDNDRVEIRSARDLWGTTITAGHRALVARLRPRLAIAGHRPAGREADQHRQHLQRYARAGARRRGRGDGLEEPQGHRRARHRPGAGGRPDALRSRAAARQPRGAHVQRHHPHEPGRHGQHSGIRQYGRRAAHAQLPAGPVRSARTKSAAKRGRKNPGSGTTPASAAPSRAARSRARWTAKCWKGRNTKRSTPWARTAPSPITMPSSACRCCATSMASTRSAPGRSSAFVMELFEKGFVTRQRTRRHRTALWRLPRGAGVDRKDGEGGRLRRVAERGRGENRRRVIRDRKRSPCTSRGWRCPRIIPTPPRAWRWVMRSPSAAPATCAARR